MDDEFGRYYTLEEGETIVEGVTKLIASERGEAVTRLPSLYDVIDPDCLQTLFETGTDDIRVGFQYAGYDIVVNGNGRVTIVPASATAERILGECGHCGAELNLAAEYPVATRQMEGEVTFYAFCDRECKTEWEANHQQTADND